MGENKQQIKIIICEKIAKVTEKGKTLPRKNFDWFILFIYEKKIKMLI